MKKLMEYQLIKKNLVLKKWLRNDNKNYKNFKRYGVI